MIKIIDQLNAGKYTVVILDSAIPSIWNKKVKIGNKEYRTEIAYDLPNGLGIIGKGEFIGKEITFI